ncbi:MAG: sigma 54-interacting transcriptional regulator [Planctomycetes bacterium]|nr:sigma 54-interacting transcriptional regulator [Planctomycetota bacterium]
MPSDSRRMSAVSAVIRPMHPAEAKDGGQPADNRSRHDREMEVLNHIATLVASTADLADVVPTILERLGTVMDMRYATLALIDNETGAVAIDFAHGLTGEQIRLGHYRLGEGVTGRVAANGQAAIIPNTAECPEYIDRTGRGRRKDTSFVCVPIALGREMLGTLSVDGASKSDGELAKDARFLAVVSTLLAQAIRSRVREREQRARLEAENNRLRRDLCEQSAPSNMIGKSREMRIVFDQIAQAAASHVTVLIHGETGTGKELVARALHFQGPRASRPFVSVNCAALPESLIESELFGHEKGAFTGAVAVRTGRFEQADGGSIFLDEIGEVSPLVQVKLLRVLQERSFERVGSNRSVRVDVRVIVATNADLFARSREGLFRSDLFYRINVFPIYLLPLRKRQSDIPLLAEHFLLRFAAAAGKNIAAIAPAAMDLLINHPWHGNVRELENSIEHAVVLARDGAIQPEHLPASLTLPPPTDTSRLDYKSRVDDFERNLLIKALKATRGNISQAAQHLGATPRIVGYRTRQLGLDPSKYAL